MKIAARITVRHGDIIKADCDAIALKYAQDFYGADEAVAQRLREFGVEPDTLCPPNGSHVHSRMLPGCTIYGTCMKEGTRT
jgi:hypothetical protein